MHFRAFRPLTEKMDRVKFALRRADTAADALVLINDRRAALKASRRLFADLFLCEHELRVAEGRLSGL